MPIQLSDRPLSFGMQNADVARFHCALEALGRQIPASERANRVFGRESEAILRRLQADVGVPATGVLDRETVSAINKKLDALPSEMRIVRGQVVDTDGRPFISTNGLGAVLIFSQEHGKELVVGRSAINPADGAYEITYQVTNANNGRVDVRVEVQDAGRPIETTPSGVSILMGAGALEVVNFLVSREAKQPLSEFEIIQSDLKPLLGDRNLAELTAREVGLLSLQSGYAPEQVAALVLAHKLEREKQGAAVLLYGLQRAGKPSDPRALHATDPSVNRKALKAAVEQGIVPKEVGGKPIEDHLAELKPSVATELRPLLGHLLKPDELDTFTARFLESREDPTDFWKKIEADPVFANRAGELKFNLQVASLLNVRHEKQARLVAKVLQRPDIKQVRDLARLDKATWKALIQSESGAVPDETPGTDAGEKIEHYAQQIVEEVEAALPESFLAFRLPKANAGVSPVATFLLNNDTFSLKETPLNPFLKAHPAAANQLTRTGVKPLLELQRVHRLLSSTTVTNAKTSIAEETIALTQKGVHSAYQIARTDPESFARENQDIFSSERAREVYARAVETNAITLALLGENGAGFNQTGMPVLPRLKTEIQKNAAQDTIPDWETLFGSFDLCACEECSSAHGPAAYFVDILHFLDERKINALADDTVKEKLFQRRPDLGEIELSCENTNTVLPYIDLVNEILENVVTPPPAFAPFVLAPTLEADLSQAFATPSLSAAFNPPLQAGARVETLEDGSRWRIWDEPFAYSIGKENNSLKVITRSLQTDGSSEERGAIPQYRNSAAYAVLGKAVFPWYLPFNLDHEEAKVFLAHLGVARHELIAALRPLSETFDSDAASDFHLAAERLGLTDTERKIIVGEQLEPAHQLADFWDSATVADLKEVQAMLDRSGLSYAELEALVATWFINPDGSLNISAKAGASIATCNTAELQLKGLTEDVLSRLHCFVRLWHKLGWTILQLDKSIRTFVADPNIPTLTNEVLVRLDHLATLSAQLRITVAETRAFWKPIDTSEPESLYAHLFHNPALFKPQDDSFRLKPEGQELVHSDKFLTDQADALQAVFRLTPAAFAALVKTDDKLTLGNLSLLYRHALLARQLRLPVQDLLTAIQLTGLDPFNVNATQDTLRFVEIVKTVGNSGFNFTALDYLIRNRSNPASPFVSDEASLARPLEDIRTALLDVKAQAEAERKKLRETPDPLLFHASDIKEITNLAVRLQADTDLLSQHLRTQFDPNTRQRLEQYDGANALPEPLQKALTEDLNKLLQGPSLFTPQRFERVKLTEETLTFIAQNPQGDRLVRLNRFLLDEAYPRTLAASQSVVIDRTAAALALPADVTGVLLGRVKHEKAMALLLFLELAAIDEKELARDNSQRQFAILEQLLKIASIIETLKLPSNQLDWLFASTADLQAATASNFASSWLAAVEPATAVAFARWSPLIQMPQMKKALAVQDAALEAILGAITAVLVAEGNQAKREAKKAFVDVLTQWLGWAHEDLETLIGKADDLADLGVLKARIPDDYQSLDLILQLQQVMSLLKRLGVTAAQVTPWRATSITATDVKAIRQAAKVKHDDQAWLKIVKPLQDSLRDKQRAALVSYLVTRPTLWRTNPDLAEADDLYAHFLIDVEMSSCQLTSRLKQAISSVQLFAQRCLLGIEEGIQTSESKWLQWEWMKNFRVWEANRKIWLYPENWIEPELRKDKTPFFKDLENELLQSDLDDDAAEQALLHYLEKLDEVAHLEMVGVYEDDDDKTLYVFGRTFHTPHIYYYRRREGATRFWTPWEKIDLDIEGDHLIPVIWNGKLMLLWPIFTEKAFEKEVTMPEPGKPLASADRYWEIQLAWSEYQHGRWSGKNLSEPVVFADQGQDKILFDTPSDPVAAPRVLARAVKPGANLQTGEVFGGLGGGRTNGGDSDDDGNAGGATDSELSSKQLIPKGKISFKAFVKDDILEVLGFLRRDYRSAPTVGDSRIACLFGEFIFKGCRKIVTTANHRQIEWQGFPLAPTSTQFDSMWFTGATSGLVLYDGNFPSVFSTSINPSPTIVGDPSLVLAAKQDITVLDKTPSPYRLLAPHQDMYFVGNRPFFFMDDQRVFMVTSSQYINKSNLTGWVDGNPATTWRADFFPQINLTLPNGNGAGTAAPKPATSLTVLVPGPGGRRVLRELPPVNLQTEFQPQTLIPMLSTRKYRFVNFNHPYLCAFEIALNGKGIAGLFSFETQNLRGAHSFDAYTPEPRVLKEYPVDEVEFQAAGAYQMYNWELFFHIPLLIATRLKDNQRFQEAQRWFHFIFDPTGASGGDVPQRYWLTKPFHDRQKKDYEAESVKSIEEIVAQGIPEDLKVAVQVWRTNPFDPHAVARLRTTAYQKAVVMKYIDNLIAWGDQLFRRETLESINEATLLYVLAAEILGRRPEIIKRNLKPVVQTFNRLQAQIGALGNTLVQLESLVSDVGTPGANGDTSQIPDPPSETILYFCVPENDYLLGYWNTVADRLFKIRHCMNIEGQVRQLPLFEPPIDPALLVRAQAAGLSIGEVLSDINASLPNYRFSVMLQKANELVAEVRNLGGALLSALEKRDGEALSLLRSGQELRLLEAVREVRQKQVDEANTNIAALKKSHDMAQARKEYYKSRSFMNIFEFMSLSLSLETTFLINSSAESKILAAGLTPIGSTKIGSPTTAGVEVGPEKLAKSLEQAAMALDSTSSILGVLSQNAGRMGDYTRRKDEWDHQSNLADSELKQIDQQLVAAQTRLAIAKQELHNHDLQKDNAGEVDEFLRGKFTNQDLYQYMIGQVSGLYFQSYQLAYDLAKQAERCFRFELGLQTSDRSFIKFGYWDSLKKGLLAGEKLQYDLRRLEAAYLEQNRREFELTKHVSLAILDPLALVQLRETGRCFVNLPEEIFDLDYPGHYFRRIKSVSLTMPCVVGPYTSPSCTLRLLKNSIRINASDADHYPRHDEDPNSPDIRFVENNIPVNAIATSSAQNDSGVFELSFRDERYLPFEGAGVISDWALELFNDKDDPAFGKSLRQFDYNTISDVILHIKYTAREDAGPFKNGAVAHLSDYFSHSQAGATPSLRMFNLRQEFPTQWQRFLNPSNPANGNVFEMDMSADLFNYRDHDKTLQIKTITLLARCTAGGEYTVVLNPPLSAGSDTFTLKRENQLRELGDLHFSVRDVTDFGIEIAPTDPPAKWQFKMTRPGGGRLQQDLATKRMEVADMLVVLGYEWKAV